MKLTKRWKLYLVHYDCINIYVSKYMSFHIIYQTLGKNIIRVCLENILFALQWNFFLGCILLYLVFFFPCGIASLNFPGILSCFVSAGRRSWYQLPLVARIWINFKTAPVCSFFCLNNLLVQSENLHLPCHPYVTCLSCLYIFFLFQILTSVTTSVVCLLCLLLSHLNAQPSWMSFRWLILMC